MNRWDNENTVNIYHLRSLSFTGTACDSYRPIETSINSSIPIVDHHNRRNNNKLFENLREHATGQVPLTELSVQGSHRALICERCNTCKAQ